jgi:hypothetical protein
MTRTSIFQIWRRLPLHQLIGLLVFRASLPSRRTA